MNSPALQETPVRFPGRKIHWKRDRLPTPAFLGFPGGSTGKESVCNVGYLGLIPGLGWEDREKGTAPHSSVLAWRIPGMGDPGGLLSMGSYRVGHD